MKHIKIVYKFIVFMDLQPLHTTLQYEILSNISLNFRYVTTNLLLQPSGLDSIYLTASVCEPVEVFVWPLLSVHNTAECWVITGKARVCRHRFSCKQKHTANYIRSKSNICTSRFPHWYLNTTQESQPCIEILVCRSLDESLHYI